MGIRDRVHHSCFYDYVIETHHSRPYTSCRWAANGVCNENIYTIVSAEGNEEHYITGAHTPLAELSPQWDGDHIAATGMHQNFWRSCGAVEVEKLRELAASPHLMCTTTSSTYEVHIWDLEEEDHRLSPVRTLGCHDSQLQSDVRCSLATAASHVAAQGPNNTVLVWDVEAGPRSGSSRSQTETCRLKGHMGAVRDVVFSHPKVPCQLASVGNDGCLWLWDLRDDDAMQVPNAHAGHEVLCVDWCTRYERHIVTGGADGAVNIWDIHNLNQPLHTLRWHNAPVTRVQWHPHVQGVLASGCQQGAVHLWTLQLPHHDDDWEQQEETQPPCHLMFQHYGHCAEPGHQAARITDLQWHPKLAWTLASCTDSGQLHIWRPVDAIWQMREKMLKLAKERSISNLEHPPTAELVQKASSKVLRSIMKRIRAHETKQLLAAAAARDDSATAELMTYEEGQQPVHRSGATEQCPSDARRISTPFRATHSASAGQAQTASPVLTGGTAEAGSDVSSDQSLEEQDEEARNNGSIPGCNSSLLQLRLADEGSSNILYWGFRNQRRQWLLQATGLRQLQPYWNTAVVQLSSSDPLQPDTATAARGATTRASSARHHEQLKQQYQAASGRPPLWGQRMRS